MADPHSIPTMYRWFDFSMAVLPKTKAPPGVMSQDESRKWNIEYVEPYGRCTIATRDIEEGEILFLDHPVVTGPKQDSELLCLGCYKQLDAWEDYTCSKCGWPVCGPECETRGYHPLECGAYQRAGYKPGPDDFSTERYMYESLLPLRCYLLCQTQPQNWETLIAMESHNELRRGTELWDREQENVVDFLLEKVKLGVDENLLHTITGILDVNCHEVRSNIPGTQDQYRVRGIYPLCAMMSHFCCNNTHHTLLEDMTMMVIASKPIKKGEQLTASYTHLLSATTERRKHLKFGKFFDCICTRCSDPTEMGTYFGALRCCQPGCGGNVLCTNPTKVENDAPWACDKCSYEVKAATVERLNKVVYYELSQIREDDIGGLEAILRKYQYILHPQHFHVVGIKHTLSQALGRVEGYTLHELTEELTERKMTVCRDLLTVLDVLDPGISRLRGLTLYELHAPMLIRANKAFQMTAISKTDFVAQLKEAEQLLSHAVYCLRFEPVGSTEGQIHKIATGSLKELGKWINTVQDLPAAHFLPEDEELTKKGPRSTEDLTLESLLKKLEEN